MLPPVVYTPAPPKPKETKRRRGVGYAQGTGDVDETEEAGDVSNTAPPPARPPCRSIPLPSKPPSGAFIRPPAISARTR